MLPGFAALYEDLQDEHPRHLRKSAHFFREYGSSQNGATLMPAHAKLTIYDGLGNLPHFNPDIDNDFQPPAVSDFRSQLNNSAGVMIATPEYAHGIPGVLKNALDWLVASGELYGKPVTLLSASSRGCFAHASLIETLTVMMARLIPEAFMNVAPPVGMGNGELQLTATADLSTRVERALAVFAKIVDHSGIDSASDVQISVSETAECCYFPRQLAGRF
jgi:chromate reductase